MRHTANVRPARLGALLAVLGLAAALVVVPATPAGAVETVRASVAPGGQQANGTSTDSAMSADGRVVAFLSAATNLGASGGPGGVVSAYVRASGTTTLVSRAAGTTSTRADADAFGVEVSDDGRFVVFASAATDLLPGGIPATGQSHVYRFDRATGAVVLVDVGAGGAPANGSAVAPSASADGRFVAFSSTATDLIGGLADGNGVTDVFLRDVALGTTRLVSHRAGLTNVTGDGSSETPSISADGRYVAYTSIARRLATLDITADTNGLPDVFRWDSVSRTTVLVSAVPGSATATANSQSDDITLSRDGRWAVFESHATDVAAGLIDTNPTDGLLISRDDVFIRDLAGGTTRLVSARPGQPDRTLSDQSSTATFLDASGRVVSDDGRFVVFGSADTSVVAGVSDPNGTDVDVFQRDVVGSTTNPVSFAGSPNQLANGTAHVSTGGSPTISADGRIVAWASSATNLVGGDGNGVPDVFVRALGSATIPAPLPPPTDVPPDVTPPPPPPPPAQSGYWLVADAGAVYAFGTVPSFDPFSAPAGTVVDLEPTPTGAGYWILTTDGGVTTRGDAQVFPATGGGLLPGERATSLSSTPTGEGYWIFTNRGGALAHGDAGSYGDMRAFALNGEVLDSVATTSGGGYYMVAADGGVFAFGDAAFHGSMGDARLNAPVQSLVPTDTGAGYWLVASDGGVFAFGDAGFHGSMGATPLAQPMVGMVRFGDGYLMVASDGGVFNFSDQPFLGSLGGDPPDRPIVAIAPVD